VKIKRVVWDDSKTKQEILKRFKNASDVRRALEDQWIVNEQSVYSTSDSAVTSSINSSLESALQVGMASVDGGSSSVNINYTFKNLRFIHAQMSSNPPMIAVSPTTSDQEDRRRADAADRIIRWSLRHYSMQEKVDQLSLHALVYGTGIIKTTWDATKGDILSFDQETDELEMEGDISVTVPFIWNLFLDPDAKSWDEVKYVIERVYMDYEEAMSRWPGKQDELKAAKLDKGADTPYNSNRQRSSQIRDERYNSVELLEYWEIGLPTNGYLGRYCITTPNGDVIEPTRPNPFRFRTAGAVSEIESLDISDEEKEARLESLPEKAKLPFHILTDIDVPNVVWGRSFIQYTAAIQDNLNRLDSAVLDNIQAHGVARMVVPESSDVDDALSNSPWDVIKISGNQPPYFVNAPQMMPEMSKSRVDYINGINDISGVNEAMFGQQSREQSGASMQYATNQGNMVRRRLFNKYTLVVESVYKSILSLVTKHWSTIRTINVLGEENAMEAVDVKGMDVDGGYDVRGEYGTTLSLDPISRREELLQLQPLFEKAGVPTRTTMKLLRLNELEGLFDTIKLAENRQKEIFDEMLANDIYIAPEELEDHENMINHALSWFMSSEFKYLSPEAKTMCKQHVKDRIKLAASEKSEAAPPPAAPAMPGMPGLPPMGGGLPPV
jgi:hypothetical protein